VFGSPTATLEVVGNTGNPSSEKAGVGGSTPSLATIIPTDLAAQGRELPPTILNELSPCAGGFQLHLFNFDQSSSPNKLRIEMESAVCGRMPP